MTPESCIAAVEDVPEDGTFLFTVERDGDEEEAILVRVGDAVIAWRNYCQHRTDVRLDRGEGAQVRDGELVCAKHGAMFATDTGVCTFGPCEGAVLGTVDVTVEEGTVYLTDGDCEFVRVGPAETGDDLDLSTSSARTLGF